MRLYLHLRLRRARGLRLPETDREALVAAYNATDGENWYLNSNWLSEAPLRPMGSVITNDDGRVTGLELWATT